MNDLTRDLLSDRIAAAEEAVAVLARERDHLRDQLHQVQAALDAQATHLRTLQSLRALLTGEHAPLAPRDIIARDDALGVRIGPLLLAPAQEPADVALYLGTLRAIQDALIRQIRLADDALAEVRRRERAADTPTGAMPAVPPAPPDPLEPLPPGVTDSREQVAASLTGGHLLPATDGEAETDA